MPGYRAGDLDRQFSTRDLDEDRPHAYGFLARRLHPYLHPHQDRRAADGVFVLSDRAPEGSRWGVRGVTHPRGVQARLGHEQVTNDWGGTSSGTTLDLEQLRHCGYLRVADRVAGIGRYEVAPPLADPLDPEDRLRALAMVIARTLASATEAMSSGGELRSVDVTGTRYLRPADLVQVAADPPAGAGYAKALDAEIGRLRRFLTPR